MTPTQFYDSKRRFELRGREGLKDLPPIHKSHPQSTPPAVVEQILTLRLVHPAWGCVRLSERLKLDRVSKHAYRAGGSRRIRGAAEPHVGHVIDGTAICTT